MSNKNYLGDCFSYFQNAVTTAMTKKKTYKKKHLVKSLLAVLEDEFMTILAESLTVMALEQ